MLRDDEHQAMQAATGAVLALGDDGRIAFASDQALALLGWSTNLLGKPLGRLVPDRLRPAQQASYGDFTVSRRPVVMYPKVQPAVGEDQRERNVLLDVRAFLRPDESVFLCSGLGPEQGPTPDLSPVERMLVRSGYRPLHRS